MRDLNIAYGNSRTAKQWSNKIIRFSDLKERLKTTIRTLNLRRSTLSLPRHNAMS